MERGSDGVRMEFQRGRVCYPGKTLMLEAVTNWPFEGVGKERSGRGRCKRGRGRRY